MEIPVKKERLIEDVKYLTGIQPPRNEANLASMNAVSEYISDEFKKQTSRVSYQTFTAGGHQYRNVIASFGPEGGPRVIVGAHYDVAGNLPGADDNASGTAGLLEIGRLLKKLSPALQYRIDLVTYALEEPPYFGSDHMGSYVHALSLKKENVKVKAMICLEMIGYYTDVPNSQSYPVAALKLLYPDKGNFIAVVGKEGQEELVKKVKIAMKQAATIDVQSINAPGGMPGIGLYDHSSYWRLGYEAVMINNTSFFRNNNYHTKNDTIDTLDFDKMAEVVKGVYNAILSL